MPAIHRVLFVCSVGVAAVTSCGSSPSSSSVASVGAGATASGAGSGPARVAALHAAAECIRQHGIPNFQDPTVSPDGAVYTDERSLQNASESATHSAESACHDLVAAADWAPDAQPPAPPAMVEAGVKAAQCLRANGLPNYRDPSPDTPYTPGHGFGLSADEVPAGGKQDPEFQRASHACRDLLDAEIDASSLVNLAKR